MNTVLQVGTSISQFHDTTNSEPVRSGLYVLQTKASLTIKRFIESSRRGTFCNPVLPGVGECGIKVEEHGNFHRKISLFYTGWGMDGVPVGGNMARR